MNKESIAIRFLYRTLPGRIILKGLTLPWVSRAAGKFLESPYSRWMISGFVRRNKIPMEEYKRKNYLSFNDFFIRKLRSGRRQIDVTNRHLISPCDGLLTIYKINESGSICLKHSSYKVKELLGDIHLANHFKDGFCMVFRLRPSDYHHYCYVDHGTITERRKIKGILHCIRPIASERYPVYIQNSREYTVMDSVNFGRMVQMEVGALLVGRIQNRNPGCYVKRGQEKGYFEFGGSTIVLLVEEGRINPDSLKWAISMAGEAEVRLGEKIAMAD